MTYEDKVTKLWGGDGQFWQMFDILERQQLIEEIFYIITALL